MNKRIEFYESYLTNNKTLMESNDPKNLEAFRNLDKMAVTDPVTGKQYLLIGLYLMNDRLYVMQQPEMCEFISKNDMYYTVKLLDSNRKTEFPSKTLSEVVPLATLLFGDVNSYNKVRSYVELKFDSNLPEFSGA